MVCNPHFAGAGLGPVIGGGLLAYFSWHSVFIINIPIVVIVLILSYLFVPNYPVQKTGRWDIISSIQIMVGLISVVYAIKEVTKQGPNFIIKVDDFGDWFNSDYFIYYETT